MITTLVIFAFAIIFGAGFNSTAPECPPNHYGENSSTRDLLDRSWCHESDGMQEP